MAVMARGLLFVLRLRLPLLLLFCCLFAGLYIRLLLSLATGR